MKERLARIQRELATGEPVHETLEGGGAILVERQLPFLLVQRGASGPARALRWILQPEAAYAIDLGDPEFEELCRGIAHAMSETFGAYLFLEVWVREDPDAAPFTIVARKHARVQMTVEALSEALGGLSLPHAMASHVDVVHVEEVAPPGKAPLTDGADDSVVTVGIALAPLWHRADGDLDYTSVCRAYRRVMGPALRQGARAFSLELETGDHRAEDAHVLGPRRLGNATREVDRALSKVCDSFEWLQALTPIDLAGHWERFVEAGYDIEPVFEYRPLPIDPDLVRRELINIRVEDVEDPSLDVLLREKQQELDRQLSMLAMRGTRGFLYGSLQLYGDADASLVALADEVLDAVRRAPAETSARRLGMSEIRARAQQELGFYQETHEDFPTEIEISDDVAAGLMVSSGRLWLSTGLSLSEARLVPILQHEIGTHVVTYYNGRKQPLGQFAEGLADYEPLQEGLGVFSEYLAGALPASRMRTIASRVHAVRCLCAGATFVETFRVLCDLGSSPRGAFNIAVRVFRGGGLTKDAVYLRGLRDLVAHIARGHEIDVLFVGKIALRHLPLVQELRRRGVLRPPAVLPRVLRDPRMRARLEAARTLSVAQLIDGSQRRGLD